MKIIDVNGIVLSETNYSESSKILNVLTDELGLIGIISKGSRNIKSKLRGVSRKLIYGVFHIYYKEDGLSTLISVDIKNSYNNILSDLARISYSSYLLDLTRQVLKESDDENIYKLLIDVLEKINDGFDPLVLTNMFELKVLDYLGVKPNIDECSVCGNKKDIITISASYGGFICSNCFKGDDKIVSPKVIKMIRMYYYVDISKIDKLDVSYEIKEAINHFLDDYYERYTGLYLKSKDFIKRIEILDK